MFSTVAKPFLDLESGLSEWLVMPFGVKALASNKAVGPPPFSSNLER